MGDAIKIAAKTALIAVITGAIIALFANIQIPALDYTLLTQSLGAVIAVLYHFIPVSQFIIPVVGIMLSFELAYYGFKMAMVAVRWVMKVNE